MPIPTFGDLSRATVATLGLNPSGREFLDSAGDELDGPARRLHTLNSLGLTSWSDVDVRHLDWILEACISYFDWNPYDRWFSKLERVISSVGASYYDPVRNACHLDLIPYATKRKWAELSVRQRSSLLSASGDSLALLLRDSPVRTLILNGNSVVTAFQQMSGVRFERRVMASWSLSRPCNDVRGIAYFASIDALFDLPLDREVLVLGYNHNLQSSFGVTRSVIEAIAEWVAHISEGRTP